MTRFLRLYPVRDTSSKNVLKSVKGFVEDFGLPNRIISDRCSCFTSHEFQRFCGENGILHTLNSTSDPQGNGMVERVHRTILFTIVTSMEKDDLIDWDSKIKETERNLNNTVNKTLGKTPFEVLHGYVPRFKDGILRLFADGEHEVWNDPEKLQLEAREKKLRTSENESIL
ncbi:hypothetical protein AVEN_29808-1 [Araneus ventricosus]|uniref:Integrase catalytic domain-containing protein n=1 Tax=Araneus ventricosus TaxID=182803 RepID=A0A4Y2GEV2_ARAVE|nr:hypothetical protein AVEN_29808-1 [Araneus ventricosus]